jgi:hypothetical protein
MTQWSPQVVRNAGAEDGGIVVAGAILMLAITLVSVVAVEIGNRYEHRRHLQIQADAAALAAGQRFDLCISDPASAFTGMQQLATQYGGFGAGSYNVQVGNGGAYAGTVAAPTYNSSSYPAGSVHSPDSTPSGDPCTTGMFDVKATESNIPGIFNFALPAAAKQVNAHARVELRVINQMKGLLPVAVPDVRFNYAFATFVNEATGAALAPEVQLTKAGTNPAGQQLWNSSAPVQVPINVKHVGVRLRLVGSPNSAQPCDTLYTECYTDPNATTQGLVHIRGWNFDTSSPPPAQLRDVWLLPGTCTPDAYFTTADCSAGIQAQVDLGDRQVSGGGITTKITATIAGGGSVDLTLGSLVGGTTFAWTANSGLAVTGEGPHPVTMTYSWERTSGTWRSKTCTTKNNNPCKESGSFEGGDFVQRAYEGSLATTGPVQQVQIYESGVTSSGSNSFQFGAQPTLGVTIATSGTLETQAGATDPLIAFRVVGSQNQTIDCDPDIPNLRDEIVNGCGPTYVKNPSFVCPNYNQLWGMPQPWPCVKTQTGGSVGQVSQGLQDRILGGSNSCSAAPINWPYDQDQFPNDPRVVPLIITPFGTFSGSGNDIVPVLDFGAFYVMAWDKCPGPLNSVPKGFIVGHFIKYIRRDSNAVGDTQCYLNDPTQITPCVAVLTK